MKGREESWPHSGTPKHVQGKYLKNKVGKLPKSWLRASGAAAVEEPLCVEVVFAQARNTETKREFKMAKTYNAVEVSARRGE
jgi:hypothetical protein